ncbi:holo-[acyl-carrier protein] synthase [Thermosyntropha lipolytica DSM 11003]|uniref:Holo-[acyl-carrier-protein] synthase n=1 Tax=Thermosyntropha lipolytica DSM 11003 TaxID=1123382 RepID=A0A1M5JFL8_9FIRM|nr:holo-ACP synthase [Thermosyntropha lipolytica]SHG39364.1 holo-[acyl-carrier protein] synthase [Thermosyntropha lipolytica DSM 11003]
MFIGIDIVDIERIKEVVQRTPRFLKRVFTPEEIAYCFSKKDPYPSLAARWAAKEALRKVHPYFASGIRFQEVEVRNEKSGRPRIVLHGQALLWQEKAGIERMILSLSHSKSQAVAAIIALGGGHFENIAGRGNEAY